MALRARGYRRTIICFLLRHADAGDSTLWKGDDDLRQLTALGQAQAADIAALLARAAHQPGAVVTSPRVRAEQTARAVADALGLGVRLDARLAGRLDSDALREIVAAMEQPCLVGHEPDISEVLAELLGVTALPMPKATLAVLDIERFEPGGAQLMGFVPPSLLTGNGVTPACAAR